MGHPFDIDTLCTHATLGVSGYGPLVQPLVQSTTFARDGIDDGAEHQYSRVSNPTVAQLEAVLGRLERAPAGVCFGSGLGAEFGVFLALLSAGDHVVCGKAVYGGTTRIFERIFSELGVETAFVDTTVVDEVRAAVRPNTKMVFIETPANPTLDLTDIAAIAEVSKAAGAKLVVDNTFMTPVLQQPLDHGADICVTSTTKFVDGHSVAVGGVATSRDEDFIARLRFIRKCTGGIMAPLNAWLTLQGVKTLPLRMRRQSESAAKIASWLTSREGVRVTHYPTLETSARGREIAARQHIEGLHGAVVSFEIDGDTATGRRFAESLELCRLVEHVGSVESLVTHPATMTHGDVAPEQRRAVGITDGLMRLSVGLEDPDRIIGDVDQALRRALGEPAKTKTGNAAAVTA